MRHSRAPLLVIEGGYHPCVRTARRGLNVGLRRLILRWHLELVVVWVRAIRRAVGDVARARAMRRLKSNVQKQADMLRIQVGMVWPAGKVGTQADGKRECNGKVGGREGRRKNEAGREAGVAVCKYGCG